MGGRGHQEPSLPGFWIGKKVGEHRVFDRVARLLLGGDAITGDAERLELFHRKRRFKWGGRIKRSGSAAEDNPSVRIAVCYFGGDRHTLRCTVKRYDATRDRNLRSDSTTQNHNAVGCAMRIIPGRETLFEWQQQDAAKGE